MAEGTKATTKKPAGKKTPKKKPNVKPDTVELLPPVEVSVNSDTIAIGTIYVSTRFGEIAAKMLKIQRQMKHVQKDAVNPYYDSHYASLDNVYGVCKGAANAEGLLLIQGAAGDGTSLEVTTAVIDPELEQFMCTSPRLSTGKMGPQPAGAVISFGRRYGLAPLFGLVFGDDDDGNAAQDAVEQAELDEQMGGVDRVAAMKAYHAAFDVVMKAVKGGDDPQTNSAMEEALVSAVTKGELSSTHQFDADQFNEFARVLTEKRDRWIEWFGTGAWRGDHPEPTVVTDKTPPEPITCTTCGEGLTAAEVRLVDTLGLKKPYCKEHRDEGLVQQMKANAGTGSE